MITIKEQDRICRLLDNEAIIKDGMLIGYRSRYDGTLYISKTLKQICEDIGIEHIELMRK